MKLKETAARVKVFLTNYPHLRDSDRKLICNIWVEDLARMNLAPEIVTAKGFLALYAEGKLTPAESIRRARQKLQEDPALGLQGSPLVRTNKQGLQFCKNFIIPSISSDLN